MTQQLSTPKGEVAIRIATPKDAPALFELRLEALAAHPEAFAADVEITRARGAQSWADEITKGDEDGSSIIVVAVASGKLIGMTGVGRGHWPKTRHNAVVWGVYVNPAWRGMRIADSILMECISWAGSHGIVVLKLGVVTTNQVAIRCYQRVGFTIYGTEPKSNYLDGAYFNEYLMARII